MLCLSCVTITYTSSYNNENFNRFSRRAGGAVPPAKSDNQGFAREFAEHTSMRKIVIMLLVLTGLTTLTVSAFGKELLVGVGDWEPYYFKDQERGLDMELLQAAFQLLPQYTLKFEYMGIHRLLKDLEAGRLDAAVNILTKETKVPLSVPFFRYINVAISLKQKNFVIQGITDFQDKSIATFQNAKDIFGSEFTKMAEANPEYREYPQLDLMADVVITGKKDVFLGDPYVFLHHLQKNYAGKMSAVDFTFHRIFPEVANPMGFRDPALRDEFNQAVEQIKANGTYSAIYEKYQQLLGFTE